MYTCVPATHWRKNYWCEINSGIFLALELIPVFFHPENKYGIFLGGENNSGIFLTTKIIQVFLIDIFFQPENKYGIFSPEK